MAVCSQMQCKMSSTPCIQTPCKPLLTDTVKQDSYLPVTTICFIALSCSSCSAVASAYMQRMPQTTSTRLLLQQPCRSDRRQLTCSQLPCPPLLTPRLTGASRQLSGSPVLSPLWWLRRLHVSVLVQVKPDSHNRGPLLTHFECHSSEQRALTPTTVHTFTNGPLQVHEPTVHGKFMTSISTHQSAGLVILHAMHSMH